MSAVYRLLLATLLVGCYSPSYDNCTISCATAGCPNSYECDSNLHVCRKSGTTCSPGHDAGGDAQGSGDAATDAGPMGCALVQHKTTAAAGTTFHVMFSSAIAAGNFVVVTLAQNSSAAAQLTSVADQDSNAFARAVLRIEGDETSAIYYMRSAPTAITDVALTWTISVASVVDVSEWHCSQTPNFLTSAMGGAQISGTTLSVGQVALSEPALVFGTLTTNTATLPVIQTQGFTTLHAQSFTAPNAITATLAAVYGFFGVTNNLDVTYTLPNQSVATGTVAVFSGTQVM